MRRDLQLLRHLYGMCLNLFPKKYREEYGEELQVVFGLSIEETTTKSGFEVGRLMLREFASLPKAAVLEHLRERRKSKMIKNNFDSHVNFPGGSRYEPFAFFVPFIVTFGLFYLGSSFPPVVGSIIRLSLLGIMLIMFMAGLSKGLPRWFLPYVGFVFSIANLFIANGLIDPKWRGFSFPFYVSQFVRDFVQGGVFWVGIIILVFLFVVLAALIPTFRPFHRQLRNDWTLLAFILYGAAPFAILLTFDDYHSAGLYVFTSLLILAIGGWLYLRGTVSWKKYLFLFMGLTLSMAVTVVGAAVLIEDSVYIFSTWQAAMADTIRTWMWLAIFMLLPLALKLVPQSTNHMETI